MLDKIRLILTDFETKGLTLTEATEQLEKLIAPEKTFYYINKTIKKYIEFTLGTYTKLDKYVPNNHIANTFKNVLAYSELENKNQEAFHNIKWEPYDSIGTNDPENYDRLEDGRYLFKVSYSVGINDILTPEYFDLARLESDGRSEVVALYQKLKRKQDKVRNTIILGKILIRNINQRINH